MIENNGKTITISTNIPEFIKASIGVECLICGQSVLLTEFEGIFFNKYLASPNSTSILLDFII